MSINDEFEFKPITKGLGFHKKTREEASDIEEADEPQYTSTPFDDLMLERDIDSESNSLDIPLSLSSMEIKEPATSKDESIGYPSKPNSAPEEMPIFSGHKFYSHTATRNEINRIEDLAMPLENQVTPTKVKLKETGFNFGAFIFDAMVVLGLTCLFSVVLIATTGIDLMLILSNAKSDLATQLSVGLLVFSVLELYMIISRSFFGYSLGEWGFDIRLGTDEQIESVWYPLMVAWRTFVLLITGLILLPILSLITRKDITGLITGIKLYRANSQ